MAFLSGYSYRKSHDLTGETGAGTNYQVRIVVHYGTGTDSGEDVYLGSKSETDFSDIRFTDNDETTELDYWIQEKTDSDKAVVWVEVADDLGSNTTIYIYYGNSGVSDASDGEATFLFFDDFEDASIDTNKWVKEAENGSITESGGYLRVGGGVTSGQYGWSSLGSSPGYTGFQDNALIVRTRNSVDAIAEIAFRGNFASDDGYKLRSDARTGYGYGTLKPPYTVGGWNFTCSADGSSITTDQWYTMEIIMVGSNITAFRDGTFQTGTQVENCTDTTYTAAGEISLQNHYGDHADYDWVAVRKIVSTEPSNGAWGSEEIALQNDFTVAVDNVMFSYESPATTPTASARRSHLMSM